MLPKFKLFLSVFCVAILLALPSLAKDFNNAEALNGLSSVSVYFDVKTSTSAKLENRLMWISDTYAKLIKNGIETKFIIGFRGKASEYVTKGDDYVFEEDLPVKQKIHSWIKQFKNQGIAIEQCAISARLFDIDTEDFFPEIQVVESSYVSIIAYQTKGYSFFPMY